MPNPMHPAGYDTLDPCDHCNELYLHDDMTYVMTYPATWIDPEEGGLICDDCLGETG